MPRLSVVMIVKNEAEYLEQCLASVRSIADEIIVADTGSTDNSAEIAERFGASVFSIPWNNDFAAARNQALAAATGDWILHMDADEMVDPSAAALVRTLVDADGEGADAFHVALLNYSNDARAWRWTPAAPGDPFSRGYAGHLVTHLLRLFRNGRRFQYREAVHENITASVEEAGGIIRQSCIRIHHYGYGRNAAEKGSRYLAIAREKAGLKPTDAKAWHDLAEQALALGETGEAEQATRRALECDRNHAGAATTLANILLNCGALDEAKTCLEGLLSINPQAWHARTALAAIACKQGRLDEARLLLEEVVEAANADIMARLYLARVLDLAGDVAGARNQLQHAASLAPLLQEVVDRLKAHTLRTEAHREFEREKISNSLRLLVEALKRDPDDPLIHFALGVVANALKMAENARASFGRSVLLAPTVAKWDRLAWPPVTSE